MSCGTEALKVELSHLRSDIVEVSNKTTLRLVNNIELEYLSQDVSESQVEG